MDLFSHDLRYALRLLLKQPAVTIMMLLTLGLGIGANTAVFSVVHAVLLRALPYIDPDQLVMIYEKRPAEGVMNNTASPADFLDWARLNQSFASVAAYTETTADLTGVGDPVQLPVGERDARVFRVSASARYTGARLCRRRHARPASRRRARTLPVATAIRRKPGGDWTHGDTQRHPTRRGRRVAARLRIANRSCRSVGSAGPANGRRSASARQSFLTCLRPDETLGVARRGTE